jgi:hypothetical protein
MLPAWAPHVVVENHRVENSHVEVVDINGIDWLIRSEIKSNNNANRATQSSSPSQND